MFEMAFNPFLSNLKRIYEALKALKFEMRGVVRVIFLVVIKTSS